MPASALIDRDRPGPEAFLRAAAQEGRGRLKIFLGAAPGVGKTYEMLSDGAARRDNGVDVVVGVVETHGRSETEALTRGYEIMPRIELPYQGRTLTEMDLDAILARRPQLVLVDELAHTNAPGSRHPKRYGDVEELLAAGIDVYSTVNIQHVESLNDVVASLTRVRVRETVPDRILEAAEIEVVDIPPDELIERLKDGKVYIPEEATRALNHFFSKSNLSALRELALRRAAMAVDAQMLDYIGAHALAGTFAAGERVLVAVSEQPGMDGLVRSAQRLADARRAPWTALHIETARSRQFAESERRRINDAMVLAAQLGAATATIPATSVMEGLRVFAADNRITQLVIGKSKRSWWFELRHGSVVDQLVRSLKDVAVHVLPSDDGEGGKPQGRARTPGRHRPRDYLLTLAMVGVVTALAHLLLRTLGISNVALLYLLPVMAAASSFGVRAGLLAGIASSLAYNYFFLPPTGTFSISNPENVVTLAVLLGVAVLTSQLAARVRAQADLAGASARQNAALAGFSRQLTTSDTDDELMQAICAEIARLFDVRTVILLPSPTGPELRAAYPPENRLGIMEEAAAQWTQDHAVPAGRGSDTLTGSDWLFHPFRTSDRVVGVIGVAREDGQRPVEPAQEPLFLSLVAQAALMLERIRLQSEMRDLEAVRERDRLRSALLSSVSHDLRTPLTSVLGAAAELGRGYKPELVETIQAEAQRLHRFVANLLDMARLEAGALNLKLEAIDLTDAVSASVHDARASLEGHPIRLDVSPSLPLVRVDPQLFHHILLNLLDNAGRYAPQGSAVTIRAERSYGALTLCVLDEGSGLPPGKEKEVFETFRRLAGSDRVSGGTGLGLAIVKGFAEAMGLKVEAANRPDRQGASFSIHFPESLIVRESSRGADA